MATNHSGTSSPPANRIIATYTGEEQPTAASEVLAAAALVDAVIIDLRQTVVQGHITLTVELEIPSNSVENKIFRSLLTIASSLSLSIEFDLATDILPMAQFEALTLDSSPVSSPVPEPSTPPATAYYVLTLLSTENITPDFMTRLATALADHMFTAEKITRLSAYELRCLEVLVGTANAFTPSDVKKLRQQLYALGITFGVDVALQAESILRRSKRLVVLDMDSTLIQQEVLDELARYAGVYDQVCEITHQAMSGKLDFYESLKQRVALLKGASVNEFGKVIANLQYTPGAKLLCKTLKKLGYRLAVISGGFTKVTAHVRNELGLDYDYANQLEEENGFFTGRTIGPIVTAQRKADLLMTIAQQERITLDQVIAIGDGANDLPMLGTAGLGIAFNAKPAVQEAAKFRINQPSLKAVLYLLGLSEQDQQELCSSSESLSSESSI